MQAKSCARASEPRDETYCEDIVPLGKLESVNAEGRGVKKIPAKAQSICPTNAPLTSRRGGWVSFACCYLVNLRCLPLKFAQRGNASVPVLLKLHRHAV